MGALTWRELDLPWYAVRGRYHSFEVGAAVDGPGIRFVAFLTGCPLRCQYCHNPDTWHLKNGIEDDAGALVAEIRDCARYLRRGRGGVTLSGGEPLAQPAFTSAILHGCKALDLHTALDTSGFLGHQASDDLLADVDLVLLDIKSYDPETYCAVTGVSVQPTLDFARRLSAMGKPMWVRFVLVPGLTDAPANVTGLADFVADLATVERVDVLPYHKMGENKWAALGLDCRLKDVQPPTPEVQTRVRDVFRDRGLTVT